MGGSGSGGKRRRGEVAGGRKRRWGEVAGGRKRQWGGEAAVGPKFAVGRKRQWGRWHWEWRKGAVREYGRQAQGLRTAGLLRSRVRLTTSYVSTPGG